MRHFTQGYEPLSQLYFNAQLHNATSLLKSFVARGEAR